MNLNPIMYSSGEDILTIKSKLYKELGFIQHWIYTELGFIVYACWLLTNITHSTKRKRYLFMFIRNQQTHIET